ncbi:phosphatidylglycerol lysyltransferase domain-containing protein [Streptomyces sp. NPDC056160]|uniref:phosphatidylglycerol lysyltransferase domain-containing protein n=1 Tax=Streptomyces sp. NPDC056160 TaxID=3345731 RepID=UPI0035DB6A39
MSTRQARQPSPRPQPPQSLADDEAYGMLRRHAGHSSAFLALNAGNRRFRTAGVDGFVPYREGGRRHLFPLGGPVCAADDRDRLLTALLERAGSEGRRVTAVQLPRPAAELHARHGFTVNQFGASFSIHLDGYSLGGQRMVKVRNMVNRARREGVTVTEVTAGERADPEVTAVLDAVDRAWLRDKGRHVKELDFLIGERGGPGAPHRRLFTARHAGRTVAYVSYSPVFGERGGWLYDLTRRLPDAPPGTVEMVFATALRRFQDEECAWLHLGFTPFVQLRPDACAFGPTSGVLRRSLELLAAKGQAIYPAATQESFKLKWRPQLIEPEYLAFQGGVTPGAVWRLMRLTKAV